MNAFTLLRGCNYNMVLIYGLFLSIDLAGGWKDQQQKRIVFFLCPVFLLVQGLCWLVMGHTTVRYLYPLIVHLPLVLVLFFGLKRRIEVAFVSVCTAYLCCQLPRWVKLAVMAVSGSVTLGEISYSIVIMPIYFFLHRCFVRIAHEAMTYSRQNLILVGSLPVVYYVFDYSTVIYSDIMYAGIPALVEFFPTASIIFYVMFLSAYHAQVQKHTQAELQRAVVESELKQSAAEIERMRSAETQTAIYQHDMRHHLNAVDGFLAAGSIQKAREYIQNVQSDVESIVMKQFCENQIVNMLCSSFADRAGRMGVRLTVNVKLPKTISVPETALCSMLSNGLENAFNAVEGLKEPDRKVEFYCGLKRNKLLAEIKNPYSGEIILRDDIPISQKQGHGHGCRSIQSISRLHGGMCSFEAEKGVFTLRIVLPLFQVGE